MGLICELGLRQELRQCKAITIIIHEGHQMQPISKEEMTVLETIREKKFQTITIKVVDGKIELIRREETIKPNCMANK